MQTPVSIFSGKFTLDRLLGKGGFGEVYQGTQTATGELVAIKLERCSGRSFLFHEARVMQDLQTFTGHSPTCGMPTLKYFGQEGDYRVLIMSLLGPSLEDLHEHLGRFSLKTTMMLAEQMISRLEYVHAAGYIHRDLKPDNFLMGVGKLSHHCYLIDFGLSTKYIGSNGQHRDMSTGRNFVGTTRYASLRTHQGISQSRRDDLEQLGYIFIYMLRGRLPWSGLNIKDRDEKEKTIGDMKEKMSTAQICHRCPRQFEDFLLYARKMEFDEQPQYEMCRMLMASVLEELVPGFSKSDFEYDWVKKPSSATSAAAAAAKPPAAGATTPAKDNNGAIRDVPVFSDGPMVFSTGGEGHGAFSGIGSNAANQEITSLGALDQ